MFSSFSVAMLSSMAFCRSAWNCASSRWTDKEKKEHFYFFPSLKFLSRMKQPYFAFWIFKTNICSSHNSSIGMETGWGGICPMISTWKAAKLNRLRTRWLHTCSSVIAVGDLGGRVGGELGLEPGLEPDIVSDVSNGHLSIYNIASSRQLCSSRVMVWKLTQNKLNEFQ